MAGSTDGAPASYAAGAVARVLSDGAQCRLRGGGNIWSSSEN